MLKGLMDTEFIINSSQLVLRLPTFGGYKEQNMFYFVNDATLPPPLPPGAPEMDQKLHFRETAGLYK